MRPRRVIAAKIAALALLTLATPALAAPDGAFISASDGYYRIIGGAALKVGSCAPLGGCAGAVPDSPANYRTTPRDGTFLRVANGPAAGLITAARRQAERPGRGTDHRRGGRRPVRPVDVRR